MLRLSLGAANLVAGPLSLFGYMDLHSFTDLEGCFITHYLDYTNEFVQYSAPNGSRLY